MLNLGIVNAVAPAQPDVSLEEVQASVLTFMNAERRLTDYMNFMEIVHGLKKHSSAECVAFATELLGVPTDVIQQASMEDYMARYSVETLKVWKLFRIAWKKFYRWIKKMFRLIISFFTGKKKEEAPKTTLKIEEKAAPKQLAAAPALPPKTNVPDSVAKGEAAKAAAPKQEATANTAAAPKAKAPAKQPDKFSAKSGATGWVSGTPATWKVTQNFTNGAINNMHVVISDCKKMFEHFDLAHRPSPEKFNSLASTLVKEAGRFFQNKGKNAKAIDDFRESAKYVALLEKLTDEMDSLVDDADESMTALNTDAYVKGIMQIYNAGNRFINAMTAEINRWKAEKHEATFSHRA